MKPLANISVSGGKSNVIPLPTISGSNVEGSAFGSGGGSGSGMETVPIQAYVDAKTDAVEARLESKLDKLPTKGTLWTSMATLAAIILGALAFAGDRFDSGLSVSSVMAGVEAKQSAVDKSQDTKLQAMDDKLDLIITQTSKK